MKRKTNRILNYFLCTAFFTANLLADIPMAILGGQGPAPYASFLYNDGTILPIDLPDTGVVFRVGINSSGLGLVGGTNGVDAYAAFITPDRVTHPLEGLIAPGEIYSVSVNESGDGLIGGGHFNTNVPYAALVHWEGSVTPLSVPASGLIYGVSINNSGNGVIGGIGPSNSAYAALTTLNGASISINNLPSTGAIFWVSNNDSDTILLGGQSNADIFASYVTTNGELTPITGLPEGLLYSVKVNSSGKGIIGGISNSIPYAAFVTPDGKFTKIDGMPLFGGKIYNVALNDSGTGLVAGFSLDTPYGAFVSSDGLVTELRGLPTGTGFVDGAALHPTGIALVGGTSNNVPFAALAAPNGQLTFLEGLPEQGEINSIGIAYLDNLIPKSLGIFNSWANNQFTLSNTLTQHCMLRHKKFMQCDCCYNPNGIWVSFVGNHISEKSRQYVPAYTNEIVGGMVGFDYTGIDNVILGGGLAYTYNKVDFKKLIGDAKINNESAVVYASVNFPYVYMNFALWGGFYQASVNRKSLEFIHSKATPDGLTLSPHMELSVPLPLTKCFEFVLEPYVAFDWVNNWQTHFWEKGESGFNIRLKDHYCGVLRSEIGLRFYQQFSFNSGLLVLEETGSYVNRAAFHNNTSRAWFVGSESPFTVVTSNNTGKNHVFGQVHCEFVPFCAWGLYGSLDYQGEFGSSYASNSFTFTLGKQF